jgi:predicted ATP-grasp superfamily ATP-dependent carboligase
LCHDERARDFLIALAARERLDGWVLFPTSDESAKLLALHHESLRERFVLTIPPWDIFSMAYDKRLTYRLAATIGVDCPVTYYPTSRDAVEGLDCRFPVILKPAIKESHNAFTAGKAWRIANRQELLARYDEARSLVSPDTILVQELIPGGSAGQFSFAALCVDGRVLVSLTARRVRQFPDDFGVATFVETTAQPTIDASSRRLLAAMGHTGLVEMDYIQDVHDDRYYLLDVNPRPWSWHSLGRRAGMDFPYLLWQLVHDQPLTMSDVRTAKWIHLVPDLQGALRQARRGQLDVLAYLRSMTEPKEGAVFALDDPVPGLVELLLLLRDRLRRPYNAR